VLGQRYCLLPRAFLTWLNQHDQMPHRRGFICHCTTTHLLHLQIDNKHQQNSMADSLLVLTGERKRAAISYAEPDDVLEMLSDEEQVEPTAHTDLNDSDDDDDDDDDEETFGTHKTCPTSWMSYDFTI
jgi:hypothetical protein